MRSDIKVEGSLQLDVELSWWESLAPGKIALLQVEREAQAEAEA